MGSIAHNLRALEDLLAPGVLYAAAGHVLVLDGYTACIYTAEDASDLAEAWQAALEDGDEDGQAYTRACAQATALRDEDVTANVRKALREASGIRGHLTAGW